MKGINSVVISGNVGDRITIGRTGRGDPACSFSVASDAAPVPTATWVRVSVYGPELVEVCRAHLTKGVYVLVEGELMNRAGKFGELTEVRARRVVFVDGNKKTEAIHDGRSGADDAASEGEVVADPAACAGAGSRP
jgi:single-stranded DNA-binding protein